MRKFSVGNIEFYHNNPLVLIAGPCAIESESHCLKMASIIKGIADKFNMPFIFKSSYTKANRSLLSSYRGVGIREGLRILRKVKNLGIPVLSDVHSVEEVWIAGKVLDIIQIPAFLCRQTELIVAAARTGKVVNIKKGQFLSPYDMGHAINKVCQSRNNRILVTERGSMFGYNNLVVDMRSLDIMKSFGFPVIFDGTHSVQLPGKGGESHFAKTLSRAAVAVGINALFLEVHDNPKKALCDGDNMITPAELEKMLQPILSIDNLIKTCVTI